MSQIAVNKAAKKEASEEIINWLWVGQTDEAIEYLERMPGKNEAKQQELLGYLKKNKEYIINYEKRRKAGKIIGSERMEKQNDVIVAQRQKRKGMSWSKKGSWSLAIITAHFNQRTNYLQ